MRGETVLEDGLRLRLGQIGGFVGVGVGLVGWWWFFRIRIEREGVCALW